MGYQLTSREAVLALDAMESVVLRGVLVGGLETGCASIQVSPVDAHLGLLMWADLFRGFSRRGSIYTEDHESQCRAHPRLEAFLRRAVLLTRERAWAH